MANQERIVARTEQFVHDHHDADVTGHDWWHIDRVRRLALRIGRAEGGDPFIIELAALLHDIADWKRQVRDPKTGAGEVAAWLEEVNVDPVIGGEIEAIIDGISFLGSGVPTPMATLEGKIVQDADRLDAIGAIGIARAFAFGGAHGRALHDPHIPPVHHATADAYKANRGPTINHFHEKLLLVKDGLQTETARRIAEERHQVMETFLARFAEEWAGRV